MVVERLLAKERMDDHFSIADKLIEAGFYTSRGVAEVSAEELAKKTGISPDLALQIHSLAVKDESGGTVDTQGGAYVSHSIKTGGRAFVGGGVNTGGGEIVPRDDH